MHTIDQDTVRRILDTADIVDVVSDFVQLKRRGQNYVGLCPFHQDRSPSFYVSRAKGICKCFSCGASASAVGFIMKHENMTYPEALKYLAKKYGIEVKERELTDSERAASDARESLLAVNQYALERFQHNLASTPDGQDVAMAYLRQRGVSQPMIERFRLGYCLENPADDLYNAARAEGYADQALEDSGLCIHSDRGTWYDRFRGRVIFPVFSVSGRVVAFGGRTMRADKKIAKYVNSPENAVYSKSRELYGLYQARGAIGRRDKCYLVEGYLDVISMHQAGVENVVASSGTSLTEGQIRLISRFTKNVTVIYDSDPAGVKASLRGIDLLLAQGLSIKVVSLPEGDDPDSFAQHHSADEVEKYIAEHEEDFIRFKIRILLDDAGSDPIKRTEVIKSIVASIAVIPDGVARAVYLQESSRLLSIDEQVLRLQVAKATGEFVEQKEKQQRERAAQDSLPHGQATSPAATGVSTVPKAKGAAKTKEEKARERTVSLEHTLLKYVLRYGMLPITDDDPPLLVSDYVREEFDSDELTLTDPAAIKLYAAIEQRIADGWLSDYAAFLPRLDADIAELRRQGIQRISDEGTGAAHIERLEEQLEQELSAERSRRQQQFREMYLHALTSAEDDTVRDLAADLIAEPYRLSRYHSRFAHVETDSERLTELVPRVVHELKYEIVKKQRADTQEQLRANPDLDPAVQAQILQELKRLDSLIQQLAAILGERTIG